MKCPKCGGDMEQGKALASGTPSPKMIWVKEGTVLKIGVPKIQDFSCVKCGFMESYVVRK